VCPGSNIGAALLQTPKTHGVAQLVGGMLGKVMIDSIREWISGGRPANDSRHDELQLALTALLIEAAYSDDHFDEAERKVIGRLIESRFNLTEADTRRLLAAAEFTATESAELFHFTRIINDRLSFAERVELIEMLWEVAYADRVLDEYEDSLLRRVGGLIYVPDRDRGIARQRVLKRLGLDEAT
jgi:uncharacterized tellurite resistance protein B-like protein